MTSTIKLASGDSLPSLGLGLWKIDLSSAAAMVSAALSAGYRHLDGACDYGNEAACGDGLQKVLKRGEVTRQEVWVTSKLWNTYHRPEHVVAACKRSLADWRLDYFDLYLIHFPISLAFVPFEERYPPGWFYDPNNSTDGMRFDPVPIIDTWRAMEQLVDQGLVRNIGVSNFGVSLLRDLLSQARIRPAVLQIESHPYLVQSKLVRYCQAESIAVTAFSPLGAGSYVPLGMATHEQSVLNEPRIVGLAKKHGKTPAQIVLRWGIQRGTAVIPKTSRTERLQENIDLFSFELSDEEMKQVASLDRHQRFNDPGDFCEQAFHTFFPIYE